MWEIKICDEQNLKINLVSCKVRPENREVSAQNRMQLSTLQSNFCCK